MKKSKSANYKVISDEEEDFFLPKSKTFMEIKDERVETSSNNQG
jgi:hypothetical protein